MSLSVHKAIQTNIRKKFADMNNDKAQKPNAILYDAIGKAICSSGLINAGALNSKQVNVSSFTNGIFCLRSMNENNEVEDTVKVAVTH